MLNLNELDLERRFGAFGCWLVRGGGRAARLRGRALQRQRREPGGAIGGHGNLQEERFELEEGLPNGEANYFTELIYKRHDRLVNKNLRDDLGYAEERAAGWRMKTARRIAPPGR